jgi:dUTP pyrophosphatase
MDVERKNLATSYYFLKIFVDPLVVDKGISTKYWKQINAQLNKIDRGEYGDIDAGFDLYNPKETSVASQTWGNKVTQGVSCSMTFWDNTMKTEIPVAYYLYPRSSTGAKTPLRLSNSVGIIDAGYRGPITALFDNWSNQDYNIKKGDRVVQICAPNMTYPISPILVTSLEELGISERGSGGFGSTGR